MKAGIVHGHWTHSAWLLHHGVDPRSEFLIDCICNLHILLGLAFLFNSVILVLICFMLINCCFVSSLHRFFFSYFSSMLLSCHIRYSCKRKVSVQYAYLRLVQTSFSMSVKQDHQVFLQDQVVNFGHAQIHYNIFTSKSEVLQLALQC